MRMSGGMPQQFAILDIREINETEHLVVKQNIIRLPYTRFRNPVTISIDIGVVNGRISGGAGC